MEGAVAVVAAVLLAYAVVERRLRDTPVSGAMVFTAVGLLASEPVTGLITPSHHGHGATTFLKLTLVIVLFTDAMAVSGVRWATEAPVPGRLLGLGLPLTIVAGLVLALALLPHTGIWEAALLAAVLAPTDSALGLPVIANRRVPQLVRHALNVEGGLNDGLALPFVTVFLALALEQEGAVGGGHVVQVFLRALLAFSLTVIRMVPVAVALLGSGLARPTVGYVGWFGPRGLASIVFADLVATSGLPEQHVIVPVVMLTVGLSVVLHGVTAPVGAQRYGSWYEAAVAHDPGIREAAEAPQPGQRVRVHGHPT